MFLAVRQRLLSAREVASKPWPGQRERLGTVRQSDSQDSHGCVIWSFGALVLDVSRFQDFEDTERQAVVKRLGLPVHKARKT